MSDMVLTQLRDIVGTNRLKVSEIEKLCYGYDAFFINNQPMAVVMPQTTGEVAEAIRVCHQNDVSFVARGAGSGYAGGSIPADGAVVILLTALTGIEIDVENRTAWVQAGAITKRLADEAQVHGLRYPPDPSSYSISTLGGNVATNAGGAHCFGYGVTSHYVLEIEYITPRGEIRRVGGKSTLVDGLDLRGVLIGSEGTLGVITGARLRLIHQAEDTKTIFASFQTPMMATNALENILSKGISLGTYDLASGTITPAANEEGYLFDGDTIAYIDIEGFREDVAWRTESVVKVLEESGGTVEVMDKADLMSRRYDITIERWRKVIDNSSALRYFLFDAIVPRSCLSEMLGFIADTSVKYRFETSNTFHAGDGNIHPSPFFDPLSESAVTNLMEFWREILHRVYELDGVLSGEHGIGIEKREFINKFFDANAIHVMKTLKGLFDPDQRCNPGKILPEDIEGGVVERSWEQTAAEKVIVFELDGYVQVRGDTKKHEIFDALRDSTYELAFDPIGWSDSRTVGDMVALGRPGMTERNVGPCRDQFLGGVFVNHVGQRIVVGSPFNKDVSAYDLRKLAYGGGGILGEPEHAWLRIKPKASERLMGQFEVPKDHAPLVLRQLDQKNLPFSYLILVQSTGSLCHVQMMLESVQTQIDRASGAIQVIAGEYQVLWGDEITEPVDLRDCEGFWQFHEETLQQLSVGQTSHDSTELTVHIAGAHFSAIRLSDATEDCYTGLRNSDAEVVQLFREAFNDGFV